MATEINKMPADEGVRLVVSMLHAGYLSEVSGVNRTLISKGVSHAFVNGKPFYFIESHVRKLQDAMHTISAQLMTTKILPGEVTAEEQPFAYGSDFIEKFKNLRKHVAIQYILRDSLGWTEGQIKMRLSRKEGPYYGVFTEEHLTAINGAIHLLALQLGSIELELQQPE